MKSIVVAAPSLAIALPAAAAPPPAAEFDRRQLESTSGVDLSREWASYVRGRRSESFGAYVDQRFRLRRDVGRGLVVAGAALGIVAVFFFCFGFGDNSQKRITIDYGIAGTAVALGGAAVIPGAALWGIYGRKLERLEDAAERIEFGAESSHPSARLPLRPAFGLRF